VLPANRVRHLAQRRAGDDPPPARARFARLALHVRTGVGSRTSNAVLGRRSEQVNVFLDETGYTGDDLANVDQPVFVLASIAADDEQAATWKRTFFGDIKAVELKYSLMKGIQKQRRMIVNFLSDENVSSFIRVAITHKHFALLGKIVDHVYEPMMRESGVDIYVGGRNIALANALYFLLDPLMEKAYSSKLARAFQDLVRQRSMQTYESFAKIVMSAKGKAADLLLPAAAVIHMHGKPFFDRLPEKHILDVAISSAFTIVDMWSKESSDNLSLVHDESSTMAKQRSLWDALVSIDVPEGLVGYDRRKTQFPLHVTSTEFRRSIDAPGVQLADVVAGAVSTVCRWWLIGSLANDTYAAELSSAMANVPNHRTWPSMDFAPEALETIGVDGQDPLDFLVKVLQAKGVDPHS
jgi:hypothetical protein